MSLRRSFLVVPIVVALAAPVLAAADDPVYTTYLEVKNRYRARQYDEADSALRHLAELLAAPEHASVRPKVLPAYYFYASAVAFERKDQARAKEALAQYFTMVPEANLDPGAYPKHFSLFFEVEKHNAVKMADATKPAAGSQSISGDALPDYAIFLPEKTSIPMNSGTPEWADSAVKFLMTEAERKQFRTLSDDDARRIFVSRFWQKLDPKPETPDNEYQEEFYRRVQFADSNFATEITKGSLSDKGQVFLILGPPTYASKGILRGSNELMAKARATNSVSTSEYGKLTVSAGDAIVGPKGQVIARGAPGGTVPGDGDGTEEIWVYHIDRIPKGVPFNELEFRFFTGRGFGIGSLQREARQLAALGKAAKLLRTPDAAD